MPPYSQSSLYDTAGIPIAVDPRIPRPTQAASQLPNAPDPTPNPPFQTQNQALVPKATHGFKRIAHDDTQGDSNKRVKPGKVSPPTLDSPLQITAPPPTPITAKPARATAGDFMAECAANGIILDITPARSTSNTDSTSSSSSPPPPTATTPPIPVNAIAILQQASAAMLKALVKKDAPNREKQLLVAVGTLRTCLDVHFLPHVDAWKVEAVRSKVSPPTTVAALPPAKQTGLSIAIPEVPTSTSASHIKPESAWPHSLGIPPTRGALRNQLANARATMDKQQSDLKHKDDEIARAKEENKLLNARLEHLSVQSRPKSATPIVHSSDHITVLVLNQTITEQRTKLNHQKSQITSLLSHNARLKKQLDNAGNREGKEMAQIKVRQRSDEVEQMKEDDKTTSWKEVWETKGRNQTPRLASGPESVSGTSSTLATPMTIVDSKTHTSGVSSQKSGSGASKGSKTYRGDPRSDWERGVADKQIGPPSPKRENVIPTGPRLGRRGSVKDGPAPPPSPSYLSENGWGDYYSSDGFGTMQADRLDYT